MKRLLSILMLTAFAMVLTATPILQAVSIADAGGRNQANGQNTAPETTPNPGLQGDNNENDGDQPDGDN